MFARSPLRPPRIRDGGEGPPPRHTRRDNNPPAILVHAAFTSIPRVAGCASAGFGTRNRQHPCRKRASTFSSRTSNGSPIEHENAPNRRSIRVVFRFLLFLTF